MESVHNHSGKTEDSLKTKKSLLSAKSKNITQSSCQTKNKKKRYNYWTDWGWLPTVLRWHARSGESFSDLRTLNRKRQGFLYVVTSEWPHSPQGKGNSEYSRVSFGENAQHLAEWLQPFDFTSRSFIKKICLQSSYAKGKDINWQKQTNKQTSKKQLVQPLLFSHS